MKVMRKTRISVALAAALAGVGASTQVMAVNKSADDIGDAFIAPYYTVRGGWRTEFTVINTSNSTVPIKVRFHEANNSRDVLDFIAVLSPQDMIQAVVAEGPNGPRLSFPGTGETTCVVPSPHGNSRPPNGAGGYYDFNNSSYTGENQDYPQGSDNDEEYGSIDRAAEGYFTIIAMGAAVPGAEDDQNMIVPFNSNHAHLNCAEVEAAFNKGPNNSTILRTYGEFERNVNALKASYSLTNVARGVQGSSEMVTLANFATTYSVLNPTPTWRYWADNENAAFIAAKAAALTNLGDAASAFIAEDTDAVQAHPACTTGLTNNNANVDNGATDWDENGTPFVNNPPLAVNRTGTSQNPPNTVTDYAYRATTANQPSCWAQMTANEQQDWGIARDDYNNAVDAYNQATLANNQAFFTIASTRVRNLIAAQVDPDWNYPNLDSGDLVAVNNWDGEYLMGPFYCAHAFPPPWRLNSDPLADTRGCPMYGVSWFSGHIRGVDAVTMLLMTSDVINEWAVNPNTGASSDWVLTAPTKRFYTDIDEVYEGIGNYQVLLASGLAFILDVLHGKIPTGAIPPFAEPWSDVLFQSCDQVGWNVYNRDEGAPPGVVPGTSPQGRINLCNETNVLYFNSESMLDSEVAQRVSQAAPLGYNGWLGVDMTASFNHPDFSNSQWHPVIGEIGFDDQAHWDYVVGMPYVGFMFKERNLGQAASYGGIIEHSYIREAGEHDESIWDIWPFPPGELGFDNN